MDIVDAVALEHEPVVTGNTYRCSCGRWRPKVTSYAAHIDSALTAERVRAAKAVGRAARAALVGGSAKRVYATDSEDERLAPH